ncbi:hypothetical protein CHS0354_026795 [Potamilus streckersoni]|uniref:Flagellar motor switch protein FliG n=1 Tax=Potamilus streckersoni TaxID=2493646 RepID=A0AAE0T585_9BIVA|nr:hypothetical protein CHS0354_026795 [Potamilus streckersoni]
MSIALTGPKKAAVLLMALGDAAAASVIKLLDEKEIQQIGYFLARLNEIDTDELDVILEEYYRKMNFQEDSIYMKSGSDFIQSALEKALGNEKALSISEAIAAGGDKGALESLKFLDPKTIVQFIINEHPQTIALILAHLDDPEQAAVVLKLLPDNIQADFWKPFRPNVINEINEILMREMDNAGTFSSAKVGGVESVAEILNTMEKSYESRILSVIEEINPELADQIRELMFTFEDLVLVDVQGMQQVLSQVDQKDIILSLKTASDAVKAHIFNNMSKRLTKMIRDDLQSMGPVKVSDVDAAQAADCPGCPQTGRRRENRYRLSQRFKSYMTVSALEVQPFSLQLPVSDVPYHFEGRPYYPVSTFFKNKFGTKVYKVSVSVAETCPNREGKKRDGDVYFLRCFGDPPLITLSINREKIRVRYRASAFLVYLQSYTNTFVKTDRLYERLKTITEAEDVVGVVIGTRPDCISLGTLRVLKEFAQKTYLHIELGVQSYDDKQLEYMKRGHNASSIYKAVERLQQIEGADIGIHLIFGFPGETEADIVRAAETTNRLGIKTEYAERVILFLEHLDPAIAVNRLAAVANRWDELVAPVWTKEKMRPMQYITAQMSSRRRFQGRFLHLS